MTIKTIPAYLEDERQKRKADQPTYSERKHKLPFQPLRHGHHRTAKQPELELPALIEAIPEKRETATATRKKPRATRKTVMKARKIA